MKKNELMRLWKAEEAQSFEGWDFSYIQSRYIEAPLPWSYEETVRSLMEDKILLDMGTGGGEFLLSLHPKSGITYATESYPPNIELCQRILPPHGIELHPIFKDEELPFHDEFFQLVINRHESFCSDEVYRILKPGGCFVTQQVGGQNNKELAKKLLGEPQFIISEDFNLGNMSTELTKSGLHIVRQQEALQHNRFYDIGALVYFAKNLVWEFPDFSVEKCFEPLYELYLKLQQDGYIETIGHRFLIQAIKE